MDTKLLIRLEVDDFLSLRDKRLLKEKLKDFIDQLADEFDLPISSCHIAELETKFMSVLEQKEIR